MTDYPAGGALFRNDRKTSDSAPDYTGKVEIDMATFQHLQMQVQGGSTKPVIRLAGWTKQGKNGAFVSLKASEMQSAGQGQGTYVQTQRRDSQPSNAKGGGFMDDEIPF